MLRQLMADEVTFTCTAEEEYSAVRGNAISSGDDAFDKKVEDEIIERLDAGFNWAWCCAKVTAEWNGIVSSAYLGCCSYKDKEEFEADDYFNSLKENALKLLNGEIENQFNTIKSLIVI